MKFLRNLSLFLLLLCGSVSAEREMIDRIVAVIGDEVILASELASQMQLAAIQTGQRPQTEAEFEKLRDDILDQMISDRLFLIAAREDTSISVRPEEIERALDNQVERVSGNFESYEEFQAALASEGMTLRELRRKYRKDVENQLLKQRYIQRRLYSVSISRHEVEEFYNEFQDSIPKQPEAARLAHILLTITPSQAVEDSMRDVATELRQRIVEGADFATVSSQYSTPGAVTDGGNLGWISRDDVVPEFSRAAFNLDVGDISGVIRTQFGYHVIKCEGKRGEQLKLRHLLLTVTPTAEDSARVRAVADSLVQQLNDGADFEQLAKAHSDDNSTRAQGGLLGWFALRELPPAFQPVVAGWTEVGSIKGPIEAQQGLHILKLLDYQQEKALDLENDYDQIKEFARQDKTGRLVDEWIEELKETTYIDIRELDYANR